MPRDRSNWQSSYGRMTYHAHGTCDVCQETFQESSEVNQKTADDNVTSAIELHKEAKHRHPATKNKPTARGQSDTPTTEARASKRSDGRGRRGKGK